MVPGAGIEPAWSFNTPSDFKSDASASFATRAVLSLNDLHSYAGSTSLRCVGSCRPQSPTGRFIMQQTLANVAENLLECWPRLESELLRAELIEQAWSIRQAHLDSNQQHKKSLI